MGCLYKTLLCNTGEELNVNGSKKVLSCQKKYQFASDMDWMYYS